MADRTRSNAKDRFLISNDGIINSKAEINDHKTHKYEVTSTHSNYLDILSWCKKLKILHPKFLSDIERNLSMSISETMRRIMKTIYAHAKQISEEKLIIFENIVKNLRLLDDPNLSECRDELSQYPHLDIFDVETANLPCVNTSVVPVYPMRTKNRGVLFFVNMINFPFGKDKIRKGAEYDKIYMLRLFREYRYTIYYYEDLMADTFMQLLNRLIHKHLDDTESLVFALATHGNAANDVQFYDEAILNVDDIVSKFNDLNCSAMIGKPKILLFPFCRGAERDNGVFVEKNLQMDGNSVLRPVFNDLLICYATVHGYAAIRDDNFGTWFIEVFCRVLAKYGHTHDLQRMQRFMVVEINRMNKSCNKVRLAKGEECIFLTPSFVSRDFNKLLFFNPGFVDDTIVQNQ